MCWPPPPGSGMPQPNPAASPMDLALATCDGRRMRWLRPLRRPLTWLAAAGGAALAFATVFGVHTPGPFGIGQPQVWTLLGLLPAYLTGLGLIVVRPGHRVPQLLLAMASSMAIATALGAASSRLIAAGDAPPWLWTLLVAEYAFDIAGPAAMGTMFLLFPDGLVRRRYERGVVRFFVIGLASLPILMMLSHRLLPAAEYAASRVAVVPSPLYWSALGGIGQGVVIAYQVATQFGLVGAALLVLLRYRRLPTREQAQTYWLLTVAIAVLADVVVVGLLTAYGVLPQGVQLTTFYAVWVPLLALLPVAIVIAVVRHQVVDVRVAVRRSVIYGAVSALIGLAFLLLTVALGMTAGHRLPLLGTVVATIVVVLVLSPVRRRLDSWAGARLYGKRLTPADLLETFGETLEHAYDLHELGPSAATMIVDGLGVSWARLSLVLPGADVVEEIGVATAGDAEPRWDPELVIPLIDRDEEVGRIECGAPLRGGTVGPEDRALLLTVARQTALAVRNAHLGAELAGQLTEIRRQTEELDESRRRLVDAQDTERRRIERDLHDGVQQQVVAVTTLLRLGLDQMAREPGAARDTVEDARRTAAEMLAGLRELVQGIRPPVLADRGLVAAIEARAARVPLGVLVDTGPQIRTVRFGADVESAAYFLVTEALANVLKHAMATEVHVRLRIDDGRLRLQVADDGIGFVPAGGHGTGLTGLADRIGAVGGVLNVRSEPGRGTQIQASLPIAHRVDV